MDTNQLTQLLAAERESLLAAALEALAHRGLPHYPAAATEENRARLGRLYDVVVASLGDRTLTPIRDHAQAVARARVRDGLGLREVHTAFNVLEEVLWRAVTGALAPADCAPALGLVSTVLGAGKEALALEYVALADPRQRQDVLDPAALFRGTA
jgi:hypothetical protein